MSTKAERRAFRKLLEIWDAYISDEAAEQRLPGRLQRRRGHTRARGDDGEPKA